jgi:hypothetical protein
MNKQTIAVVVGAAVLFVVAVVGAMAFTSNDSSGGTIHTMRNSQMMTGMMDDGMMGNSSGHTMSGGQSMTGPMHTMSGGEQMPGMTHP